MAEDIAFVLNGAPAISRAGPMTRLSDMLRQEQGAIGTKSGCDAGDCGACTVLIDGALACACLVPVAQVQGAKVITIEGLPSQTIKGAALQQAFLARGAAQCGICTPAMLVAAAALLEHNETPSRDGVKDALGGVLCRCTGYAKIIDAVLDVAEGRVADAVQVEAGAAVGASIIRLDGGPKVMGLEVYGADAIPADALWVRAIRSPHHHAGFRFGDFKAYRAAHAGIVCVLTASGIPGRNLFGVIPPFADQPVFAV